jgi:hypothetical protein
LASVEQLLQRLREGLRADLSWETKRRIIEILIGDVRVLTRDPGEGKRHADIAVTYRFTEPVATCTGKDSSRPQA